MTGRRSIGKQLEEFLVSMGPAVANLGIMLNQAIKSVFSLDTPSGRALRRGGDLVAQIAQADEARGGKGIAVLIITHGYGPEPVPRAAAEQATRAAREVIAQWDVTRDSPRWN